MSPRSAPRTKESPQGPRPPGPQGSQTPQTPADTRDVVITGVGVVTALGNDSSTLAMALAGGATALRDLDGFNAAGAPIGNIPLDHLPEENRNRVGRLDRICRLFLSAAFQAVQSSGLDIAAAPERVGLCFGTGLGCLLTNAEYFDKIVTGGPTAASPRLFAYTVSSAAAGEVSIALGIRGANLTLHSGLAAGLQAIASGADLIRLGKADVVLAGGADALGASLLQGLADLGVLRPAGQPFSSAAPGFCPGEGAAVLILEEAQHARAQGRRILAHVEGYAAGFEPSLTGKQPQPDAIIATLQRAQAATRTATPIGAAFTSASGGRLDAIEQAALRAVLGDEPILFTSKAALGEALAASAPISVALALEWLRQPPRFADGVAWHADGSRLTAAAAANLWAGVVPSSRRGGVEEAASSSRCGSVLVHSLCYTGPVVALLLGRPDAA